MSHRLLGFCIAALLASSTCLFAQLATNAKTVGGNAVVASDASGYTSVPSNGIVFSDNTVLSPTNMATWDGFGPSIVTLQTQDATVNNHLNELDTMAMELALQDLAQGTLVTVPFAYCVADYYVDQSRLNHGQSTNYSYASASYIPSLSTNLEGVASNAVYIQNGNGGAYPRQQLQGGYTSKGADGYTFSVWVKFLANGYGFSGDILWSDGELLILSYNAGTSGGALAVGAGVGNWANTGTAISLGTWYNLVYVINGAATKVYTNNVQSGNTINRGSSDLTGIKFLSGAANGGQDGIYQNLAFWQRVLTAGEIADLWNEGRGLTLSASGTFPSSGTAITNAMVIGFDLYSSNNVGAFPTIQTTNAIGLTITSGSPIHYATNGTVGTYMIVATNAMTIQSTNYNISSSVNSARAMILAKDVVNLNTDVKYQISNNNGSTWSNVTMQSIGAFNATYTKYVGETNFSSVGTQMVSRISATNGVRPTVHGEAIWVK